MAGDDSPPGLQRVEVLRNYGLLDGTARPGFDEIVQLAAQLSDTPLASISVNDVSRERFISCRGIAPCRISLGKGFGGRVVDSGTPMLVNDTRADVRFRQAPLAELLQDVRFFAGVPLISPDGVPFGTLAVMDRTPRHLPREKLAALSTLASQVVTRLELERHRSPGRERRVVAEAVDEPRVDFHAVFDAIPGLYWVVDTRDMTIVAASDEFLEAVKRTRDELLGLTVDKAFPVDPQDPGTVESVQRLLASLERVKASGQTDTLIAQRYPIPRPASAGGGFEEHYWTAVNAPAYRRDGSLAYIVHRTEDVTELLNLKQLRGSPEDRRAFEIRAAQMEADVIRHARELERLNEHLAMAQSVAHVGSWELRLADDRRTWSDEVYRILGVNRDDYPEGDEALLAVVHPDDLPLLHETRKRARKGDGPLELTHRIIRPDGTVRYVQERARLQRNTDGQPEVLYGTVQDITEQKLAEFEINTRARRQHAIASLGQRALQGAGLDDLRNEAVLLVTEMLEADHGALFEVQPGGHRVRIAASAGWKHPPAPDAGIDSSRGSLLDHALKAGKPVLVPDLRQEARFSVPPLLGEEEIVSGMLVSLAGADGPSGLLAAFATRPTGFSSDDAHFLQSIANVLAESTQRLQATAELRVRATQQAAVSQLGREALKNPDLPHLQQLATELVATTFDVEYCMLLERLADGGGMKLVAGVGWKDDVVGHAVLGSGSNSLGGYTIQSATPVLVDDLIREMRFHPPPLLLEHGATSGISVSIPGEHGAWGVIAAYAVRKRQFTEDDTNFFQSIANVLAEVTRRASVDSAIRDSEQRTRQIIDTALDAVISIDADGVIINWNPQAAEIFGWSTDDAIGRPLHELIIPPRYRDAHLRGLARFRTTGTGALIDRRVELSALHREGFEFPVELAISPLRTNTGLTFSAFVRDITERKQHEASLRDSEERFRIIARATIDTIWDWNLVTDEIWWNEGMWTRFGYDEDQLEPDSRSWKTRIHPDDRERVIRDVNALIESDSEKWEDDYRFRRKDGSYAQVQVRGYVMRDRNGKAFRMIGGMDDVTQQREYEARLRQQAELLDKAQDAIIVRDMHNRVTYLNRSAERLYGWSEKEALGTSVESLFYRGSDEFHDAMRLLLENGEWSGQIMQRRRDGTLMPAECGWTLVTDDAGQPQAVLAINTDITDRVALEDQLRQSQRLESIGKLTGGVAHDFNNLLTVILGNAELMLDQLPDGRMQKLASMTRTAAQRGAELTHRLLAFARRQALEPRVVDVNQLILGMEDLLRRTLLENIAIEVIPADELWAALVDPAQLESVLLNLAINAKDAMDGGGRLTIETGNVHLDEDYASSNTDVAAGNYVLVAVSDTGHGIAPDIMEHVFDPFFTTKEKGKGTGLGLSMAYGFAKQSGGHIKLYSEPDQGTTVKLYLPRASSMAETAEPEAVADSRPGGHEKVLIVEDDDLVREHARNQLVEFGYDVLTASDGKQALEVIRQEPDIDLLFTDVIMSGGMNGRDLAEMAKRLRPRLRILYTSGYTENAIIHHGRLDPGVHLLQKPYRSVDLAKKLRVVLNEHDGKNG